MPPETILKIYMLEWLFQCFLNSFTQILFKLFDHNSECFAKYDAFCSHYARVRLIAIEEVRNYGKFVYIKNIFENGW